VIAELTVSVAVTVWLPAVLNVTGNVPVPLESAVFAGNVACVSVLVKCTVPYNRTPIELVNAVTVTLITLPLCDAGE